VDQPSIEEELRSRARPGSDAEDFHARFINMKTYLTSNYYPWIQANCPFFTDHGELHIHSVIQTASQLLAPLLANREKSELTDLDLFLILASILWHDVGNVYGRSGHAKRVV